MKVRIKRELFYYCIIGIIIWFFISLGFHVNNLPFRYTYMLLGYQIFFVIVPGTAVLLLFHLKIEDFITFFTLSYALGYILNIIVYFLCQLIRIAEHLLPVYLVLSGIGILVIWKKRKLFHGLSVEKKDYWICILFLMAVCTLLFVSFCCNNLLPTAVGGNSYYNDNLHWMGNSVELAMEFPPKEFRSGAFPFHYHYFSSIPMAVAELITGIPVIELGFAYSFVQSGILLIFSAFCFFRYFVKNRFLIVMAMTILFFTAGAEMATFITFTAHIYSASFGFDISLAFAMLAFFVFARQGEQSFNIWLVLLGCLMFACSLGSKGPTGAIVLSGLGILCLFWLFQEKDRKKGLLIAIILLAIFAFLYLVILSGAGAQKLYVGDAGGTMSYGILQNPAMAAIFNRISAWGLPGIVNNIIFILFYCLKSQISLFLLFFVSLALKIFYTKKITAVDISCVVIAFCGIALTRVLKHFGYSQIYFMMATYPFVLLFAVKGLAEAFHKVKEAKHNVFRFVLYAFLGAELIIMATHNISSKNNYAIANVFQNGYRKLSGQSFDIEYENTYVTPDDYIAYQWIRTNTDKKSVCVNDQYLVDSYTRPPYAQGVMTERHMYISNMELIKKCMNNDPEAIGELRKNGVSYVIQTKRLFPDFYCPGGEKVYDGNTIAVYDIR